MKINDELVELKFIIIYLWINKSTLDVFAGLASTFARWVAIPPATHQSHSNQVKIPQRRAFR